MKLAVQQTHINLLYDTADLTAYLFERDLKWYHAVLSLNGNKGSVCSDLIRRINASRAIGIPPFELYEAIDEALGTRSMVLLKDIRGTDHDIKAATDETIVRTIPAPRIIKPGQTIEPPPKTQPTTTFDYAKAERLAGIWLTDNMLARGLGMEPKDLICKMLDDSQLRKAVERGRKGRSRGDRKFIKG